MADDGPSGGSPATGAPLPPTPPAAQAPTTAIDAALAPASSTDDGTRKRPRDARLIHMILANQGVSAYQERVPLQLLDFCYRYTSATLQDALHLTAEFGQSVTEKGKVQGPHDLNAVSLPSLRLSIASRTHYQLSAKPGKEHLIELATERNKVSLPPPVAKDAAFRLPPDRYVLSGVGWSINEGWESEGEEEVMDVDVDNEGKAAREEEEDEDEEVEGGRMEDLYGNDPDADEMDIKEE
jgi:transcription initiation factor TFIID subunit 9B